MRRVPPEELPANKRKNVKWTRSRNGRKSFAAIRKNVDQTTAMLEAWRKEARDAEDDGLTLAVCKVR
jgi:hypothetical protein